MRRMRFSWLVAGAAMSVALAAGSVDAKVLNLTKIAETGDSFDGGAQALNLIFGPVIDGDHFAFVAVDGDINSPQGVFEGTIGGPFSAVALGSEPLPGETEPPSFMFSTTVEGGSVAFRASTGTLPDISTGIYAKPADSSLTATHVIDLATATDSGVISLPSSSNLSPLSVDGDSVIFEGRRGTGGALESGIFTVPIAGGAPTALVEEGDTFPSTALAMESFFFTVGGSDNGHIAFQVTNENLTQAILTRAPDGTLEVVADASSAIAGTDRVIQEIRTAPVMDGGDVVFGVNFGVSEDSNALVGLFDGALRLIADDQTPVPDGSGDTFSSIGTFVYGLDAGRVLFAAIDGADNIGLYLMRRDGTLWQLVEAGDIINGKVVTNFDLSRQPVSGNRIAFSVIFDDDTIGAFSMVIPEPASLALLGVGLPLLMRRRAKRGCDANG